MLLIGFEFANDLSLVEADCVTNTAAVPKAALTEHDEGRAVCVAGKVIAVVQVQAYSDLAGGGASR